MIYDDKCSFCHFFFSRGGEAQTSATTKLQKVGPPHTKKLRIITMTADADAASSSSNRATEANAALAAQLEERLIQQEYKIWKKNTPFLYDFVMTHGLEWPSLTCQWLPTYKSLHDGQKVGAIGGTSLNVAEQHELLIGTHTTGEQNYLMVATVNLPREDAVIDNRANAEASSSSSTPAVAKEESTTGVEAATSSSRTTEEDGGEEAQPSKKVKTSTTTTTTIIDAPNPASNYNEEKNELGGYYSTSSSSGNNDRVGKIDIKMKIPHEGEVNRARYMPQNHFVVATRGPGTDVYVWDLSKHPSFPSMTTTTTTTTTAMTTMPVVGESGNSISAIGAVGSSSIITPNPNIICRGHTGEGYGVAWCGIPGSHDNVGKLITSSEDKTVCLWDVKNALKECGSGSSMIVSPTAQFLYHTDVVEDVDWHNKDVNMIGSCGDDKIICLWDIREGKRTKPMHIIAKAHDGDVNSMEFHPTNEFLLASGGSDKVVKLWDMRNLSR